MSIIYYYKVYEILFVASLESLWVKSSCQLESAWRTISPDQSLLA
jgi:hypothetical protein